jgi:transposase
LRSAFDCGKLKGARCIWGGRGVLYMAAMSASNWNPVSFHDRLVPTGKKPKVVIVAVMRRMLTVLNAMVRRMVVFSSPDLR